MTHYRFGIFVLLFFGSLFVHGQESEPTDTSYLVDDGIRVSVEDWPWWRGPNRIGVAHPQQDPPIHWDATKNVIWKSPIDGKDMVRPWCLEIEFI